LLLIIYYFIPQQTKQRAVENIVVRMTWLCILQLVDLSTTTSPFENYTLHRRRGLVVRAYQKKKSGYKYRKAKTTQLSKQVYSVWNGNLIKKPKQFMYTPPFSISFFHESWPNFSLDVFSSMRPVAKGSFRSLLTVAKPIFFCFRWYELHGSHCYFVVVIVAE